MALFGRETQADQERVRQVTAWLSARSPYALASVLLGVISVVDSFTLVIGATAGAAAIVTAIGGRRHLARHPQLLGRRLCVAGITLGILGLCCSLLMWTVVYPALESRPAAPARDGVRSDAATD